MTKRNIRIVLLVWDAAAIVLIFFSLIMMFEIVIKNLLIESSIHVYAEVVADAQTEYANALGFLKDKSGLPYPESVKAISRYLKEFSLNGLKQERSLALVVSHDPAFPNEAGLRGATGETVAAGDVDYRPLYLAAAGLPAALPGDEVQRLEKKSSEPDLAVLRAFYKKEAGAAAAVLSGYPDAAEAERLRQILSVTGLKRHVEFSLKGRDYIGVASFLSVPLGQGLNRQNPVTFNPVLVVADTKDDFFSAINAVRNLFLAILGGIVTAVFAVKLYNTIVITREIKSIAHTIEDETKAIGAKGEIGSALKELSLNFHETSSLFGSYSELSVKLADVGEIIAGIADKDLFTATLRNDKSLLDPHEVYMAVLFLDVQGFTAVAEKHKERAMSLINRIWSRVEEATGRRAGKINKYMGDAALIIFPENAAGKAEPPARRASLTAVEILEGVPALKKELGIEFTFRIGIDYGKLVYGKTGSDRNYELGVIGDPVNTASRCEALNKKFGTNLLLTGEAAANAGLKPGRAVALSEAGGKGYELFLADQARPQGKKEAKRLFTLIVRENDRANFCGAEGAFPAAVLENYGRCLEELGEGISAWQADNKKPAAKKWAALAKQFGRLYAEARFSPAKVFLSRLLPNEELARLQDNPAAWLAQDEIKVKSPDADWIKHGTVELSK